MATKIPLKATYTGADPTGLAEFVSDDTIPNAVIGASAITATKIAASAVTSPKVAASAITFSKIAASNATSAYVLSYAPGSTSKLKWVEQTGGGGGTAFPFFLTDGDSSNIPLTADSELPFFLTDGSASDIPTVT